MRKELLAERAVLRAQISLCMHHFMTETDTEKAKEMFTTIKDLSSRVEQINCKLAHDDLIHLFKRGS